MISISMLPDELWIQIFEYATDEDVLLQPALPTSMSNYAWYIRENFDEETREWKLRSPEEALNVVQREAWEVKMALSWSCRRFRGLVRPFLYRCLFFGNPERLKTLDFEEIASNGEDRGLGWHTKRIHVAHGSHENNTTAASDTLSTLLSHTTNLGILIISTPMSFSSIANSLSTTRIKKTLHTLSLTNISHESLSHLIWTLDSLRHNLQVAHLHLAPPPTEDEEVTLGTASGLGIEMRKLRQLSLAGRVEVLLDQMSGWTMKELRVLSVHIAPGRSNEMMPDFVGFLTALHEQSDGDGNGGLWFLDLNTPSNRPLDVPKILETCKNLRVWGFNSDWRLEAEPQALTSRLTTPSHMTVTPHQHIHTILLHGLEYAFNSGGRGPEFYVRRSNDQNFAALTREQFAALRRVRVSSGHVLRELERNGGPSSGAQGTQGDSSNPAAAGGSSNRESGTGWAGLFAEASAVLNHPGSATSDGMARWERWYDQCAARGIRLEDCTGGVLGELPPPLDIGDDDEDSSEEESSDESEYESFTSSDSSSESEEELHPAVYGLDPEDDDDEEDEEEEEEEVAEALLTVPSEDDEGDTGDKGKGKAPAIPSAPSSPSFTPPSTPPSQPRRRRPRLSIEETKPYIKQVKAMTKANLPPPPSPPASPTKRAATPTRPHLKKPHVKELRQLVEACRIFEEEGEREERIWKRQQDALGFGMGSEALSALRAGATGSSSSSGSSRG